MPAERSARFCEQGGRQLAQGVVYPEQAWRPPLHTAGERAVPTSEQGNLIVLARM